MLIAMLCETYKKIRYDKNVKASALDLVWVRLDPLFFHLTLQLQKTLNLCNHIHDAEQESYPKKTLQQKRCFIVLVCKPLLVLPLEGRKLLKNSVPLAKLPLVKHFAFAFMHLSILKTSNCKEFVICFVENCFTAFSFLKKKMWGERTCFL